MAGLNRRGFLISSGTALAAAGMPALTFAQGGDAETGRHAEHADQSGAARARVDLSDHRSRARREFEGAGGVARV